MQLQLKTDPPDESQNVYYGRIELDLVFPNPDQPRKFFDPKKLDLLAQTLKERGDVEEAITVVPRNGKYMIVDGERRYRAAIMAGLKMISVKIKQDMPDSEVFL